MSRALIFFIGLFFLVAGGTVMALAWKHYQRSQEPVAGVYEEAAPSLDDVPLGVVVGGDTEPLTSFKLTDSRGATFDSESLDGKVHVASFFFSVCPHNCLSQNQRVAELQTEFGGKGVKFLSITCDPKNDTPAVLARYSKSLGAKPDQWKFLTGEMDYLSRVGNDIYKLPVMEQTHSERLVLVDQEGRVRGAYRWNNLEEMDKMRRLIRDLLSGEASEPAEAA